MGAVVVFVFVLPGFKGYELDKINKSITVETAGKEISEIRIDTDVHAVLLETWNEPDVWVGYVENSKYSYSAKEENGVVYIRAEYPRNWAFFLKKSERFILVKVPLYVDKLPNLTISTDTGDVRVLRKISDGKATEGEIKYGDVNVSVDTGSVEIAGAAVKNVTVRSHTGSVKVRDVSAEIIDLSASTGSITLKNPTETATAKTVKVESSTGSQHILCRCDSIEAVATTGSISVEGYCDTLSLKASTGSVSFTTDANVISAKTSTGSIRGTVKGVKTEYNIEVDKGTGSANIVTQIVPSSEKRLKVGASTGSINVNFAE